MSHIRSLAYITIVGACFGAIALVATCSAQEIPLSKLPQQMRQPVPDSTLYRVFLHHAAAFERHARSEEAQGRRGDPFRNHFIHKLGINAIEQQQVANIALAYDDSMQPLREQREAIVTAFRNKYFPGGRRRMGDRMPSLPPELIAVRDSINALTLQARDQIHSALGDQRFGVVDRVLRATARHDFNTVIAK